MKLYILFLIVHSISLSSCVDTFPSFESSNFLSEANKKLQAVYAQQSPPTNAAAQPTYGIASSTSNLFANVDEINKRLEALQKLSSDNIGQSWQNPSYARESNSFQSSPPVSSYRPQYATYSVSANPERNSGQFPDPLRGPLNSDTNYAIPTPPVQQMFAPKQYGILRQISSTQPVGQNSPPATPAVQYDSPVYGGRPLELSFGIQHGLEKPYPQPQYAVPTPQQYQQSSLPQYPSAYQSQLTVKPNLIKEQSLYSSPADDYSDYKYGYNYGKNGIYGRDTLYPDESSRGRYGFAGINFNRAPPVYQPMAYSPSQLNPISSLDYSEGPAFKSFMESIRG